MKPERSCGFSPSSAVLTIAVPAPGVAAVAEGVVERLGRRLAGDDRVLVGVVGRGRLVGERRCRSPRAAAGGRGARAAWSAVSTSSSWTAVEVWVIGMSPPSSSSGALGLPGLQVEEEVALEEQPRADRDLGVVVDRLALVVDGEGDLGGVAVALDAVTLPTLTPAIRTGEPTAQRGRVLERRA